MTFTATVSANSPGSGTPTGTVTFMDGSTSLGTGTLSGGVATFSISTLPVGSHSITGVYSGDYQLHDQHLVDFDADRETGEYDDQRRLLS